MIQATKFTVAFTHTSGSYETEVFIFKQTENIDSGSRVITVIPQPDIDNHILNFCKVVVERKFIPVDINDITITSVVEG